ncbi:MAG TPA: RtcB family protein [Erysipelothrix sp.]|nr:RtcB family protein [Erysipelothrix sp.]
MILIQGKYNEAKVFTTNLEATAHQQIQTLVDQPFVKGSKIRIMPDVHAGAGSTIGTTMTITDKVVPNMVGVDIGCGMLTTQIKDKHINFKKLDEIIKKNVPSGFSIRRKPHPYSENISVEKLKIRDNGKNDKSLDLNRAHHSIGTLGGGNHFIEVNVDENDNYYLVIHSGSRNIGLQVALHYQKLAAQQNPSEVKGLEYLEGQSLKDYLHDMKIIQEYALLNRKAMAQVIIEEMGWTVIEQFSTIHNYIDIDNMILRKGAVSAQQNEKLLIPLNMRDGSLLCIGKGNPDWNNSAPHGAGRTMSRTYAKDNLSLKAFEESMKGIYTTSIKQSTLDEAPMAYKDKDDILQYLSETAQVISHLTPVYNFKAS